MPCPLGKGYAKVGSNSSTNCRACELPGYLPPAFVSINTLPALPTQVTFSTQLTTVGRIYCVAIIQPSSSPPTEADIRAGHNAQQASVPSVMGDVSATNVPLWLAISGLNSGQSYNIYCVGDADDQCGSAQTNAAVTTVSLPTTCQVSVTANPDTPSLLPDPETRLEAGSSRVSADDLLQISIWVCPVPKHGP